MIFSSVSFIYVFLPAVLLVYYSAPQKAKNLILLLFSLLFYFCGEPVYCLVIVATSLLGYGLGMLVDKTKKSSQGKLVLFISLGCTLAPLLFFKYADFFLINLNNLSGWNVPLLKVALPIGISFYSFQILSYLVDVYQNKVEVQKNPITFMTYVTLFPQLIAGPIVRYTTVQRELIDRRQRIDIIAYGIERFCIGLGKKVLLADSFFQLIHHLSSQGEQTVLSLWIGSVAYTLQIYYDFSGYSDMAIGLGRMFGFHFDENFNYPYIAGSVTEFWRRWHISLGNWFRDYVYIPLGGNRCSKPRWMIHILVVWFLTGFWHGAAWSFILWGLYFGLLLLAEKFLFDRMLKKVPVIGHIYTLLIVNFGFVLFREEDIAQAWFALKGMLGGAELPFWGEKGLYYLISYGFLLFIGCIGSTPLPGKLAGKVRSSGVGGFFSAVFCAIILLLTTAYLVDGSFSPFLYFRF